MLPGLALIRSYSQGSSELVAHISSMYSLSMHWAAKAEKNLVWDDLNFLFSKSNSATTCRQPSRAEPTLFVLDAGGCQNEEDPDFRNREGSHLCVNVCIQVGVFRLYTCPIPIFSTQYSVFTKLLFYFQNLDTLKSKNIRRNKNAYVNLCSCVYS